MSTKRSFAILPGLLLLLVEVCAPAGPARAASLPAHLRDLPSLPAFVSQVVNGEANQLRGVYVSGLFADEVVQQPEGYPDFVSRQPGALTQFHVASELGSIGLLAHEYLAGRQFPLMEPGEVIHLVYGDGRIQTFRVARLLRYRALQPNSSSSTFEDLSTGERLDATTLFWHTYGRRGALIFQTCIATEGIPTWGRLFVVADPYRPLRSDQDSCDICG